MHRAPSQEPIPLLRPPLCRSLASRLQSPWRTTLNLLCPSSLSPQPKTLKRPPWDAAGASDASFQGNLACLLFGYADGGLNLHVGGNRGTALPTSSHDGRPVRGGCSLSEGNRHARRGALNQKAGCPEAPPKPYLNLHRARAPVPMRPMMHITMPANIHEDISGPRSMGTSHVPKNWPKL